MFYTLALLISVGTVVVLVKYALGYVRSPLRDLPGPPMARFTNLWRLKSHYDQTHIDTQLRLHAEHGDVVLLGPNVVSVANPNLIKTIYSTRGTFIKVWLPT